MGLTYAYGHLNQSRSITAQRIVLSHHVPVLFLVLVAYAGVIVRLDVGRHTGAGGGGSGKR